MQLGEFLKKQQIEKVNKLRENKGNNTTKSNADESFLTKRRKKLHMSLIELSAMTHIKPSTLRRWEDTGMTEDDSIAQINRYAKVMHFNLQKLIKKIN